MKTREETKERTVKQNKTPLKWARETPMIYVEYGNLICHIITVTIVNNRPTQFHNKQSSPIVAIFCKGLSQETVKMKLLKAP